MLDLVVWLVEVCRRRHVGESAPEVFFEREVFICDKSMRGVECFSVCLEGGLYY